MIKVKTFFTTFYSAFVTFCLFLFSSSCDEKPDYSRWDEDIDTYKSFIETKTTSREAEKREAEIYQGLKKQRWEELINIIAKYSHLDPTTISYETSFKDDLNIDNQTLGKITDAIEKIFLIKINENETKNISTVGVAHRYIEKKIRTTCWEEYRFKESEKHLLYTQDHVWILVSEKMATFGLTDFGQREIGDTVYVVLPEVGNSIKRGEELAIIECVKVVLQLLSPISGLIVDVNYNLIPNPELINCDPYGKGWIAKMELHDTTELDELLTYYKYNKSILME